MQPADNLPELDLDFILDGQDVANIPVPARRRGRPAQGRGFVREYFAPLQVDLEALDRDRRREAIALWNVDRRAAQEVLRRKEFFMSKERRRLARLRGVIPPRREYMPQIRLRPEEIPELNRVPTYRNLEEPQGDGFQRRQGVRRTEIVDSTSNERVGDVYEYALQQQQGAVPARTVNRLFQNMDTAYVFRRYLFEASLPPGVDQMSNADKAWNLGQVVYTLIRYCVAATFQLTNDIASSLNIQAVDQLAQTREMWSSIMLHRQDGESRYSGFRPERLNEEDTIKRMGEFLLGQSQFDLIGDLKIEIQLIVKATPQDAGRNWATHLFDHQTRMRGYEEGEEPAPPSRGELPPDHANRPNWVIRESRFTRVRQEVDPTNIIQGGRRRRVPVAGYQIEQTFDKPFRHLAKERDWTVMQPEPTDHRLTEKVLERMHYYERRKVVDPKIPFGFQEAGEFPLTPQVGAYEIMEPHTKLFYQHSIIKMYARDGSVLYNPETESFSCFLMAFIRAENIRYEFDPVTGTPQLGFPYYAHPTDGPRVLECLLPEWSDLQENYPFVEYDVQAQAYFIQLYNTAVRGVTEEGLYPTEMDPTEVEYWELAAREVEFYIYQKTQEWIDVNDLEVVAQTVSTLFQVVIQIYDIQVSSGRTWIFSPNPEQTIGEMLLQNHGRFRVVSLLYDQGHMIPIRSLRKFLTFHNKHDLKKNAYCVFCEQHGKADMKTVAAIDLHQTNCCQKFRHQKWGCYNSKPLPEKDLDYAIKPVQQRFCIDTKEVNPCCVYCYEVVLQEDFMKHRCNIQPRKDPKERRESSRFYVYDIEAAQIQIPGSNLSYHICNMLVLRKMYPETAEEREGIHFKNEYEFMDYVMEGDTMKGSVILAHNGGSYDHHFIVRYLERLRIPHSFIPTPNSLHKFLAVTITSKDISFLDFIHFMPGSLEGISESLGLSLAKGDFPHRFNRSEDISYRGCIPPMDTEEDFWCLSTKKSQKKVDELKEFHAEQCTMFCTCVVYQTPPPRFATRCVQCGKQLWIMKDQMYYYCKRDVDVLAEACAAYRDQLQQLENGNQLEGLEIPWEATNIEPFDFMTVPQLALQILLKGFADPPFRNSMDKVRKGQRIEALVWLERIRRETGKNILHRQNYHKEYYDYDIQQCADGYCPETREIFVCLDCDLWACEDCHHYKIHSMEPHPLFPMKTYMDVHMKTREIREKWLEKGAQVIFACDVPMRDISEYDRKCLTSKPMADFFKGGRTEVFQPYYKVQEEEILQYHDVCSLYPYVCAFCVLPYGIPQYIPGFQIEPERVFHRDREIKYWGYIRARVRPNPNCLLGLLPQRNEDGRLVFSVEEQEGCWGLDEMELAVSQGYELLEIYEIIHWEPGNRSDQLFRGYVDYFLTMKQQSEGWKKLGGREDMTPMEQDQLLERLFESNGRIGRVQKESVAKNPTRRALAKLFLNSLWGKFAQKPKAKKQGTVYTAEQFVTLWCDKSIKKESIIFRETGVGIFKYECELEAHCTKENAKGNIFLAAKVTEHARCILHRQMLRIGPERILYCDTDSIIFAWYRQGEDLTGIGLGKWTDEHPNDTIVEFLALAPKFYMLVYSDQESDIKVKGVQLTIGNTQKLPPHRLKEMLWQDWRTVRQGKEKRRREDMVEVDYMSIYSNCQQNVGVNYGVMMTRYGKKMIQVVLSKRTLVRPDNVEEVGLDELQSIRTVPIGSALV